MLKVGEITALSQISIGESVYRCLLCALWRSCASVTPRSSQRPTAAFGSSTTLANFANIYDRVSY
jgi:hypothetical protein